MTDKYIKELKYITSAPYCGYKLKNIMLRITTTNVMEGM